MNKMFYGAPGAGKTTLMHRIVAAQRNTHRFMICDSCAEWGPDAWHWGSKPPPIIMCSYSKCLENCSLSHIHDEDFLKLIDGTGSYELPETGIFVFTSLSGREVADLVVQYQSSVYVDDEADEAGDAKDFRSSALYEICHRGRHTDTHMMIASRQPTDLAPLLRKRFDECFLFRNQSMLNRKRFVAEGWCTEKEFSILESLPNFKYLHYPSHKFFSFTPPKGAENHTNQQ